MVKKKTQQDFWKKLADSDFEDRELIETIERYLLKKRGYILDLPKKGEVVVLMLSGGMDSIWAWYLLLAEYKVRVYPVSRIVGMFDPKFLAIRYFSKIFKQRFPKTYCDPFVFVQPNYGKWFRKEMLPSKLTSEQILGHYDPVHRVVQSGFHGTNSLLAWRALLYVNFLRFVKNLPIVKIYCGVLGTDGQLIPSQTLSHLRVTMLGMMTHNGQQDIQFSSILFEKEWGIYMTKKEVTDGLKLHNLPISKTYSCSRSGLVHCGKCVSCRLRRSTAAVGVHDTTIYRSDYQGWRRKIKLVFILTWLRYNHIVEYVRYKLEVEGWRS